jgi:general secretion pathway protein B
MSYILEALRKADREREMARARPADLGPAQAPPPRSRALWPWIAVAGVLVNAGVVALVVQNMPGAPARLEPRTPASGAPSPGDGPAGTVSAPGIAAVVSAVGPPASPQPTGQAVAAGASSAEPARPPAPPAAPVLGAEGHAAAPAGATPSRRDGASPPIAAAAASSGPRQSAPPVTSPSLAADHPPADTRVAAMDPPKPVPSAPAALPAAPEMQAPRPRVTEPGRLDHTAGSLADQRGESRPGASAWKGPGGKEEPSRAAAPAGASPRPPAEAVHPEPRPGQRGGAPAPAAPAATGRALAARGPDSLRLDVHVYSERPAERMVFINNKKYVEGQQVEDRLRLEEITSEGAVLSADGQRIFLGR